MRPMKRVSSTTIRKGWYQIKKKSRIEDRREEDSNEDTHSTMMPTSTNCPSMDSFISSHDTSMLTSLTDNNNTSTTPSSNAPYSAPTIHPSSNSYDLGALEMEPFLLTSEPTRAG
jgi:hypothetical protein